MFQKQLSIKKARAKRKQTMKKCSRDDCQTKMINGEIPKGKRIFALFSFGDRAEESSHENTKMMKNSRQKKLIDNFLVYFRFQAFVETMKKKKRIFYDEKTIFPAALRQQKKNDEEKKKKSMMKKIIILLLLLLFCKKKKNCEYHGKGDDAVWFFH